MPDLSLLTTRQREIYDFIRKRLLTDGIPPSIREIGSAVGIKGPNGVACHLKALRRKGIIRINTPGQTRSIALVVDPDCCPTCRRPLDA